MTYGGGGILSNGMTMANDNLWRGGSKIWHFRGDVIFEWPLIEITFRHGCSPVKLLHIFRTPFYKITFGKAFF